MSDPLNLRLLGTPEVSFGGTRVGGFISAKAQALLFYLATTGTIHAREVLATLLWGDMPTAQAGKNLRNALSNLRSLVGDFLIITRSDVKFDRTRAYWFDVELFVQALGSDVSRTDLASLHRAVELYQGDFLDGFLPGDALPFEEWMLGRRALLNGLVVQALHTLVVKHLAREEYAAGIEYANRLLAIEPWREETHRHLMLLYARSRQRSQALAQYYVCCTVLKQELGTEPLADTTVLYQRIKAAAAPPPHNIPPQLTPLVGRERELAEIRAYLDAPEAQLLTLVGPGGIGKTRLALQAAARCIDPETNVEARFGDGVFLVSLTEGERPIHEEQTPLLQIMADALRSAQALGRNPGEPDSVTDQKRAAFALRPIPARPFGDLPLQAPLLNYLRGKEMLILLDNFERRINEARQLGDILRFAPRVKLLVTSRIRLNLQQEYVLEVQGLDYPPTLGIDWEAMSGCSAVCLFVSNARRARSAFETTLFDAPAVARICQLVQGVPLGIELAASWVRLLNPAQIADEIERNLDFLTSALQDVPERHRSLRAVFDYSWNMLNPAEQAMFRALAVFRGGFDRDAALQVVAASLPMLAGLVDKSLVRRSADGRFEIHELLWRYAEEKLGAQPAEHARVHDAHCRYYAELLSRHQAELKGEQVGHALAALDAERENVRAAWNWAVSHRRVRELNLLMECL